jgi:hypothetical protein
MEKEKIISLLKGYNPEEVNQYASYCLRLFLEKDKNGKIKNPWIQRKTEKELANLFKRVANEGLVFDGIHITLQYSGISYDYIAYKNKMFVAYPESKIDVNLVYKDDDFVNRKINGRVEYTHILGSPFNQKNENVIGAYCVIKNRRGEFLTILSRDEIDKHRKVAKTDYIWQNWFLEMALKTVIKKACRIQFADIYQDMEKEDNINYDLDNPLELSLKMKKEMDKLKTRSELRKYYKENKGAKGLDDYLNLKIKRIEDEKKYK